MQIAGDRLRKQHGSGVIFTLLIIVVIGVGVYLVVNEFLLGKQSLQVNFGQADFSGGLDVTEITEEQIAEYQVPADNPRYLSIPTINIYNARVMNLGYKYGTDNQMGDPVNIWDAGWWNGSSKPGTGKGNVGLYDCHSGVGIPGLCANLLSLKNNDLIIIERGDGVKINYHVTEIEQPKYEDVDMAKLLKSTDPNKEGLSIITCSGSWIQEKRDMTNRTTIRAVAE